MTNRLVIAIVFLIMVLGTAVSCNVQDADMPDDPADNPNEALYRDVSAENLPQGGIAEGSKAVSATDVDGDSDNDIVIAAQSSPNKVLINNGEGVFEDESTGRLPQKEGDSQDVTAADFNGDALVDLFFANEETRKNELYLNEGDGIYTDASDRIPLEGFSLSVAAPDLDNNGDTDLVIGNSGDNYVLLNNGDATFTAASQLIPPSTAATRDIEITDIDLDGDVDLFTANSDNNRLLINTGNGFFQNQTASRLPLVSAVELTFDIETADVNGDGYADLFFANTAFQSGVDARNRLFVNTGNGVFRDTTLANLPGDFTNTTSAKFTDIDNDNDPDLLTANANGGLRILINDGDGNFTEETGRWLPDGLDLPVNDIAVSDFDGDGRTDIYLSSATQPNVLLLRNQ